MNRIILYIVIFFLPLSSRSYSQVYWETIKTQVNVDLTRVFFLDSLHVWAAGDSGTIIFSSDKGENWEIQSSGLQKRIEDIFFLNHLLGWAVTWHSDGVNFQSQILFTINGGLNWESRDYRHSEIILKTIFFTDSLKGWIGGEPFDFSYTLDGGTDWQSANIDTGSFTNFPLTEIKFSMEQLGFAVGGINDFTGVVWRTTNGGELWKSYGIGPDPFLDFLFLDSGTVLSLTAEIEGFFPMGELTFYLLENNWQYKETELFAIVNGLDSRTNFEIWGSLSRDKNFILTNDSLKTWQLIPTPDSLYVFDIDFADSLHGIAVGERGYIFKYIPQPVSVNEKDFDISANKFLLQQNYPNPFNTSTVINWESPAGSWQTLKIYDVIGNEVATLVDQYYPAGSYTKEFNPELSKWNLASGIYFYQLSIGELIQTKKMILLK